MPTSSRAPVGRRAAAASAAMLGGAVAAHAAAGGGPPPVEIWALLAALLAMTGAVVARVGPRRRRSLALVGASQYLGHQLLAVTSHLPVAGVRTSTADAACGAGHAHAHAPCGPTTAA